MHMGRKKRGGATVPLSRAAGTPSKYNVAWTEVYFRTKWRLQPSSRLATVHQRHRQDRTDRQPGQRSDSIGRTVLQTVAQKSDQLGRLVVLSI